jgi:hypothetical protein
MEPKKSKTDTVTESVNTAIPIAFANMSFHKNGHGASSGLGSKGVYVYRDMYGFLDNRKVNFEEKFEWKPEMAENDRITVEFASGGNLGKASVFFSVETKNDSFLSRYATTSVTNKKQVVSFLSEPFSGGLSFPGTVIIEDFPSTEFSDSKQKTYITLKFSMPLERYFHLATCAKRKMEASQDPLFFVKYLDKKDQVGLQ